MDIPEKWEPVKGLSTKHKQILSLFAQGEKRSVIGKICGCTPEYVTMLAATEQGKKYVQEINAAVETRLEAMFDRAVDVIEESIDRDQPMETRLKGARLHAQLTGRISNDGDKRQTASAEDIVKNLLLQVNVQVNNK